MNISQKSYDGSPTLYLIPTPIGNFEDITIRALNILKMVDVIFCEDTRVAGQLLKHFEITKKLVSSHEHNESKNKEKLLEYLSNGESVGLISDRGTPIISDPGYELAKFAIDNGYNVVSLPGATALIPALTSSGIEPMPFYYYGFLNSKESSRLKELENLKNIEATLIFYESPHRINKTLIDLGNILGNNRKISISREITKKYEEIYRGTIGELINQDNQYKGELVIVISGNNEITEYKNISIEEHIEFYLNDGKSTMDAIKMVAKERGLKKSEVYDKYHNLEKKWEMKLIVGLGNPGLEYEKTRHNIGFLCIDKLCEHFNVNLNQKKFNGVYTQFSYKGEKIILLKPLKYMNLSGEVIRDFINYFKIETKDILVICDDLDTKIGNFRLRYKGSSGGHNGLKNIELHLSTKEYKRIKLGVSNNKNIDTKDYVLGKFSKEEMELINPIIDIIPNIIEDYQKESFENLMNKYNKKTE